MPERTRPPAPPRHLSRASKRIWRDVVALYELETRHEAVLKAALEALDRAEQARETLATEGTTVEGRFGPKAHPAIAIERDSKALAARLFRELGLDLESPAESRPPTRWRHH